MTWVEGLDSLVKIATIVMGVSAVLVPIWTYRQQKRDYKVDKIEQDKIRKKDKEEQRILRQKEDALRQWNANYPHRLQFYTEFYDTLFRLVNYRGSVRQKLANSGTETRIDIKIRPMDIFDFCMTFNRLDEEAKMLFGEEISNPVHMVYTMIKDFVDMYNIQDLSMIVENNRGSTQLGNNFNARLVMLQKDLQEEKMNSQLRKFFASVLTFPINKKEL